MPAANTGDTNGATKCTRAEHEAMTSIGGGFASKYGEITERGFRSLAERIRLGPDDVFVDCGSGLGLSVSFEGAGLVHSPFLHAPELAAEYVTPAYFAPERDLFARLPSDCRPDYRWLIVGGTRSGSGWHVDPNASSAWNAVIRGSKKWILTPPGRPPPGITASDDGATVTAPVVWPIC